MPTFGALRVPLFVVLIRRLTASNTFKATRFIPGHFRRGVGVGIFQESQQTVKVLLGELINWAVRELIVHQPDPCDKIIFEGLVLSTYNR